MLVRIIQILIISLSLFACKKDEVIVKYNPESGAKEYYEAMRYFDKRSYSASLRMFEEFSKKYSIHSVAMNSVQMEILLNYLIEKYAECYAISDLYIKFYPLDRPGVEYASYMKIQSKTKMIKASDISANDAMETKQLIREFKAKYPISKRLSEIEVSYRKIVEFIASTRLAIGDQYYNKNNFIAALKEYEAALEELEVDGIALKRSDVEERISVTKAILVDKS